MNRSVVLLLGALACIAIRASAQKSAPLPIDVALAQPKFPSYMPIALSPDGAWVAYTLQYPARRSAGDQSSGYLRNGVSGSVESCRLWLTDVRTGRTIAVADQNATTWAPAWSPDGKWLAYYSDEDGVPRLWARETATGRSRRVSDAITRSFTSLQVPRWTPDSRRIVTRIIPYRSELPEARATSAATELTAIADTASTVTVWHTDRARPYGGGQSLKVGGGGQSGKMVADLAAIDLATGTVRTLASGLTPLDYRVAPDGRFLAFTTYRPMEMTSEPTSMFGLFVVPLDAAGLQGPQALETNAAIADFGRSVVWSPDGATLLYSATDSAGYERHYAVRPGDWHTKRITLTGSFTLENEKRPNIGRSLWWRERGDEFLVMSSHGLAAISTDGLVHASVYAPAGYQLLTLVGGATQGAAWTDDGHSVIAVVLNDSTKRTGFARIDVDRQLWQLIREDDRSVGTRAFVPLDISPTGTLVFESEDAQHPPDLWTTSDFAIQRRLTNTMPRMQDYKLGVTRLIEWNTTSGASRRGTLLLPSNYTPGTRYPLVVYPYPLSYRSEDLNVFGVNGSGVENMQLLATRGFAVLAPDVPPIQWTDQMRELAGVIIPGVDRVIELGIADSNRVGVMGHSWGGYTVLALLVQTQRFHAGLMRGGFGDRLASYGTVEPSGWARGALVSDWEMGGTVWEQRERFIQNSPIYFFDRIHTPLLIVHGEAETTVPIFLADQVVAGLQRLGKEVEYARYKGENHGETAWRYANQKDYVARIIRWFETRLGIDAIAPKVEEKR